MSTASNPVSNYIDIFAGCGGLSLGFFNSNAWKGLFAIEKDSFAFNTLKHNLITERKHFTWPSWLEESPHDIKRVIHWHKDELLKLRGKVDLVAGGPPCQGFSTAGRRRESDSRNKLIESYVSFIRIVQPKFLMFENVKGFNIAFTGDGESGVKHSDLVIKMLGRSSHKDQCLGYEVSTRLVDFSQFGVPQLRSRFILFGVRKDHSESLNPDKFFEHLEENRRAFLAQRGITKTVSLASAISDLAGLRTAECPDSPGYLSPKYSSIKSNFQALMRVGGVGEIPNSHRLAQHSDGTKERFKHILKYCKRNKTIPESIKEKFGLKKFRTVPLDGCRPAFTLTTLPDDYIHYNRPRIFTVREYARIQTFNDWYHFKGKYTTGGHLRKQQVPRYSQIGNAVPPLFAEQASIAITRMLHGE